MWLVVSLSIELFAPRDPETGELRKMTFGPWMMRAFGLLARLKGLRGTRWDLFGRSDERKRERALIAEYEATVADLLAGLGTENHGLAVEIAQMPEHIRGFGHVKEAKIADAKAREAELLAAFRGPAPQADAAE